MENNKKAKIRNILTKYKNRSMTDASRDHSFDSRVNMTSSSSRPQNNLDKKQELFFIKEECE